MIIKERLKEYMRTPRTKEELVSDCRTFNQLFWQAENEYLAELYAGLERVALERLKYRR